MRKSLSLALCVFSLVSAFFVSCEVGLGKAVDTSAPAVEIEAPESDFIVRENFVMSGTCSDDQGVVSIKISLQNTTTHRIYGPFDANLEGQNYLSETGEKSDSWKCGWTCEINPLDDKNPIPDGDYEATATAKDAYGHSTAGKKSFTIDNTPPLLVLTRPSTKIAQDGSEQNFDTYGAEFDITGQVADASNIDKLVVSVFSDADCKNRLKDIELKNVPPTIELSAAKWGAEENDELYGNYEEIYGSEKAGTKQFYCTVTVYDEARHCPSREDDEGNSRTAYYLYKDIYSALLNKYKVTELYHILNGSYDAEENANSKNARQIAGEVNAILDSFETKAGSFTLNPENSPTFTLSGFDSLDLIDAKTSSEKYQKIIQDDSGFGLLNGSAITVKFSAGLDKSPLVEESLGFYLVPYVQNTNGAEETWEADLNDKIWIIKPYEKEKGANTQNKYTNEIDVSGFENEKQAEAKIYYENARKWLTTVGSYDFTATMNIASSNLLHIKTGNVYRLVAVGCDENGNTFLNDSEYGLYLQSSGLAPSISVTEIDGKTAKSSWYVAGGNPMRIKGTVSAEDKTEIRIKVTDNAKNTVAFEGEEIVLESSDSPSAESWELVIPNKYFESAKDSNGKTVSANYTVNITAACGTRSTEKEISVGYDVEGPEIEIASILPYASLLSDESSGNNVYTVNGKFSVKVRASDSFYKLSETEDITLEIFDSSESTGISSGPIYTKKTGAANFEDEIDSRVDLKNHDKKNLRIVVTAYDYAGNRTEVEQPIYLDQDTDKPVIELQNAVTEDKVGEGENAVIFDYTKQYPANGTKNVFLSAAELSAKISDDDGIGNILVNLYKSPYKDGDKPIAKYTENVSKPEITSNPYLLTYSLPSESEEFRAEIIVKDTENGTEKSCVFFLKIDSGAPTLKTFYQIESQSQNEGSSENPKQEIQNANSVAVTKPYRFIYEASGNYGLSGKPAVKVYRTDSNGNTSVLDSSSYTDDFALNGTDGKGGTGTISVSSKSGNSENQGSGIQDDGTYSYEIKVTDANGKTAKAERFIVFDTSSPEISVISPDENSEWITAGSDRISLNGTATDDNGIKFVFYKKYTDEANAPSVPNSDVPDILDEQTWTKAGWKKANGTASWKIKDYELSEGSNRTAFAAVDIYGNCSVGKKRDFKYDGKAPELSKVEITKYSGSDSDPENQKDVPLSEVNYLDKSVKKIRLNIEASDNLDLESLRVSVKKDGNETDDWKTADSKDNLQTSRSASGSVLWTWTSSEFTLGDEASSAQNRLEDGIYEIYVTAADVSGQTKTNVYSFTVDTLSPTATSTISASSSSGDKSAFSDNGTWHSSAKPILTVSPADATSGIAAVYYMVDSNPETPLDCANLKKQTIDLPLTKSGDIYSREISLNEGENYIYIKVEDNAGNFAYYGASDNGGSITWFVDKTGPVIKFNAPDTSSKLSSKVGQSYSVSVSDEKSGIADQANATVKLGNIPAKTVQIEKESDGTFTVKGTFSADEMSKITENSAVLNVTVSDAVGNSKSEKLTLTFDNEAPNVKITNPPLETVNGKITISGTTTDNDNLESVKLYRTKFASDESDPSLAVESIEITDSNGNKTEIDAVLIQTFTGSSSAGSSAYNWTTDSAENGGTAKTFDTTKFADGSKLVLYVVAKDSAQNTKTESKTLTIDQDADRPEIKFTNLLLSGMSSAKSVMNKNETVFGTVQDDDGVNEMFISSDGGKTWSENVYDGGSWKYTFEKDESYKLAFKVLDSEGREFVSGSGGDKMLGSPKLYDGSGNKFGYKISSSSSSYSSGAGGLYADNADTFVYLQTDTQNPAISASCYILSERELSFTENEIRNYRTPSEENMKKWQDKSNLSMAGGNKKYLYWLVDSQDASGIKSASANLGGTAGTLKNTNVISESSGGRNYINVFAFDVSQGNGSLKLSYSVTDEAERKTSLEHSVILDNSAPKITVRSHKDNASVYGSEAINLKGVTDDCEKLYIKLTDSGSVPEANHGADGSDKTQWERIDEFTSTGSWSVNFSTGENKVGNTDYYAASGTLNGYYDKFFTPKSYETSADIQSMYIWLYGEDSLGNVSVPKGIVLKVNPQGDRPNVTVSYPETSGDSSNLTSVGGTIRLTGATSLGSGSGDVKVDSVWIQIDPSYDGTFDENWKTELESLMADGGITENDYKIESTGINNAKVSDAIKAKGSTSSWNLTINANKEFNPLDKTNRKMAIRVWAYSSSNKLSEPVVVPFELDPNTPVIGGKKPLSLVQYETDSSGNKTQVVKREQPYTNNMWISGKWYLTGSIEDDSGIRSVTWAEGSNPGAGSSIIGNSSYLTEATDIPSSSDAKNYYFSIPVGTDAKDSVGTLKYSLTAFENSSDGKNAEATFSFQYDNKAPELKATDAGYKNELSSSGLKIVQSNGTYTLNGTVNEDSVGSNQSGFSRVMMFFTRTLNGINYVVDPMIPSGTSGMENALDISSLGLEAKDGIYWKKHAVSDIVSDVLALTEEPSESVRIGGICRIDDIDYKIKSVDYTGKTVTLSSKPSVNSASSANPQGSSSGALSASSVEAYFAMAQVIDNLSYENGTTSAFDSSKTDSITNGDGDQMVEGVSQSGTTWKWSASIDSSLILDGAITVNLVAFDEAGNASGLKKYSGTVSNNAPRIAGVMFGNDDDNNGTVDEDELVKTYSMIYTSLNNGGIRNGYINASQIADDVVIPFANENGTYDDAINIKGAFLVRPEIVGGNKGLGYTYKVTRKKFGTETEIYSVSEVKPLSAAHSSGDDIRSEENGTKLDDIKISISEMVSKGITDGKNTRFIFTLWDNTDGAVAGDESNPTNSAKLSLYANVSLFDEESPSVQINPFYWNSKDDNSVHYKDGNAKGHIELEDDWKNASGYDSGAASGEYDGDPKVSGTIKIEGTASDNAMLKELYLTVPGLFVDKLVGEYVQDGTTKAWSWNEKGDLDKDGFSSQIENTKFDNTGHDVKWTVTLNTESIANGAALDVSVKAMAKDRGKLQYSSGSLSYAARTESGKQSSSESAPYRMDVVPYITGISTSLSSLKKNNSSVYNRTALGHYPVSSAENVTISGFNLKGATISDSASTANIATLADSGSAISVAGFTSGKIKATVNGIQSLNNENSNDASGAYSLSESGAAIGIGGDETIYKNYYYNRQPNGDNNNLLTDDVVFDVWEFNSKAATVKEAGYIVEPVMKINPKNGAIGFAFNNGPAYFSMANGQNSSFALWQRNYARNTTTGFAIDSNGVSHGITVGLDTNPNSGHAGRMTYMTSEWGIGTINTEGGNYNGQNTSRIESIGVPSGTYNGISYADNIYLEERFSSPALATSVHTDGTYVYLAYYDDLNQQIRFRWGNLENASANRNKTGYSFDQFADQTEQGVTDNRVFESRPENYSVPASSQVQHASEQTAYAGEFVSIDVISGPTKNEDVVVMAWYDSKNSCLWYSYKKSPCNDNDMSSTHTDGHWSSPIMIMDDAGENCKIAVDIAGGIHIAAYDVNNADLIYAYLPSYSATTPKVCTVDSYSLTGTNITLDVAVSGDYVVPYIGYYMISSGKPKIAYLDNVISVTKVPQGNSVSYTGGYSGEIPNGSDLEAFTGAWEVSMVPTESRMRDDYVNVGLWKTAFGEKTSPADLYANYAANSYQSGDTGYCYGNGTSNPVMGYAIRVGTTGYIETAQMK